MGGGRHIVGFDTCSVFQTFAFDGQTSASASTVVALLSNLGGGGREGKTVGFDTRSVFQAYLVGRQTGRGLCLNIRGHIRRVGVTNCDISGVI